MSLKKSTPKEGTNQSTPKEGTTDSTPNEGTIENVPEEENVIGTTESLFGSQDSPELPKEEPKIPEAANTEQLFDFDNNKDKKMEIVVDGVKQTMSLAEIVKIKQQEGHLTQKTQAVADKDRLLNEQLKNLAIEKHNIQNVPKKSDNLKSLVKEDDQEIFEAVSPVISKLEGQIKSLHAQVSANQNSLRPVLYQNNMVKLDGKLKEEGLDDFMTHLPKIEEYIFSQPPEKQASFDNLNSFEMIYKTMKLNEFKNQKTKPVNTQTNFIPPVVNVEGGNNVSTAVNSNVKASNHLKLFDFAKKSGKTEDWAKVFDNMYD